MNDKNPKCLYCLDSKRSPIWKPIRKGLPVYKCVGFKPCEHCSRKV